MRCSGTWTGGSERSVRSRFFFSFLFWQILVHGSDESAADLKKFCEETVCKSVTVAVRDKCLDISSDSSAYKVILKDSFAQTLNYQLVRICSFCFVSVFARVSLTSLTPATPRIQYSSIEMWPNFLNITFESEQIFGSNFQRMVKKKITNFVSQIFRRWNAFVTFLQQKVAKVEFLSQKVTCRRAGTCLHDFRTKKWRFGKLDFCNFLL